MILKYETRDGKGNDIVRDVEIKQFETTKADCECAVCHRQISEAIRLKEIVSGTFTDYQYLGDWICPECSKLFSLYKFSYIVDPDGIRLLNVRQLRDELIMPQKPPFRFVISTSQKKHLFYWNRVNETADPFWVNLEQECILTSRKRQKELFDLVECLQTLGAAKAQLAAGELPFALAQDVGMRTAGRLLARLREETSHSREIQIPLFCGQKREIEKEEAICIINSILTA